MGYKRCLEANELEDLSLNKAKRFECNNELVSLDDIVTPNKAFAKTVITGDGEDGFYNIQWYDPIGTDASKESPYTGDKDVKTNGHFSSCSGEDDTGSGATSLSSASSDCLEFDIPQKAFVPLDDDYLAFDCSPRKSVPVGPNHQAIIPVWGSKVNKMSELSKYNHDSPSSGLLSTQTVDEDEERLMGTSLLSMHESSSYSSTNESGRGRKECNCLDRGSIRCIRQHVREARENLMETFGKEKFVNLGFCDMGEDVAQQWTEEEEDMFHEVVYSNPASLGRNFWKHLSVTFCSRTNKEIVSYYFNVFMLQRRAAQNRSRFLDIDSDDDECNTRSPGIFGFENSDDSAIESLGDQDVHVENQDNYSDEEDDDNSDDENVDNALGLTGCEMGNTTELEGEINRSSSNCKVNSQVEGWSNPDGHVSGAPGILNYNIVVQDDSCMSFECDANMVSCHSHGFGDASSALQARGFKCDQSPRMQGRPDLSSNVMEHAYLMDPCVSKDWYHEYTTCPAPSTDLDFLPTSNLIEEFFGTLDKNTISD